MDDEAEPADINERVRRLEQTVRSEQSQRRDLERSNALLKKWAWRLLPFVAALSTISVCAALLAIDLSDRVFGEGHAQLFSIVSLTALGAFGSWAIGWLYRYIFSN